MTNTPKPIPNANDQTVDKVARNSLGLTNLLARMTQLEALLSESPQLITETEQEAITDPTESLNSEQFLNQIKAKLGPSNYSLLDSFTQAYELTQTVSEASLVSAY